MAVLDHTVDKPTSISDTSSKQENGLDVVPTADLQGWRIVDLSGEIDQVFDPLGVNATSGAAIADALYGVSPKLFGAVGDASYNPTEPNSKGLGNWVGTDDTAAIQACIDYAETNNVPIVFDKLYLVTQTLSVNPGVTFVGNGPSTGIAVNWLDYVAADVLTHKFIFTPTSSAYVNGIPVFKDAVFSKFGIYGPLHENWASWGTAADNPGRILAYVLSQRTLNLRFESMHVDGVNSVTIGDHMNSHWLFNTIINTGRDAVNIAVSSADRDRSLLSHARIIGNTFERNGDDAISIQGYGLATPPQVNATTVAGSTSVTLASDVGDIVGQGVCIDQAGEGGKKFGAIVVSQVTTTIVLDRPVPTTVTALAMSYDCYIRGSFEVSHNYIKGHSDDTAAVDNDYGRGVTFRNVIGLRVSKNRIDNTASHGIKNLYDNVNSVAFDNTFSENEISRCGQLSPQPDVYHGISLRYVGNSEVSRNIIDNCPASGIYLQDSSEVEIIANAVRRNCSDPYLTSDGQITLEGCAAIDVNDNISSQGFYNGVAIKSSDNITFLRNKCNENNQSGSTAHTTGAGLNISVVDGLELDQNIFDGNRLPYSISATCDNIRVGGANHYKNHTTQDAPWIHSDNAVGTITSLAQIFDSDARGTVPLTNMMEVEAVSYFDDTGDTYTIAAGEITIPDQVYPVLYKKVDTEAAGATDTLTKINGGKPGQLLILYTANAARDVTVQTGASIRLDGGTNKVLDRVQDTIMLVCFAADVWYQIAFSDGYPN